MTMLGAGTRLGPYEIVAGIGAGGMGEVYRATDPRLDRAVAIKVLPASVADDPQLRERFEREAKAIAALNHPNIVTIHSVEQADGRHFITMELVEGRTLAELISKHGMTVDKLLEFAIPLSDAIAAAHQRGITHRDLKPSNVMVTGEGRLKVLDFGLAKRADAAVLESSAATLATGHLTGEGRIVGTVAYMSPEQAEGKTVDHRTDVFSLGVMLYEMATGERPFGGDTSLSVLSSIVKDTPRMASDVNPRVPRELARIIRRCLVKDPENRYQSAKDLRNELRELKQEADSGELAAPKVETSRSSARTRLMWAEAFVVAAAVTVAAVAWLMRGGPTRPENAGGVEATFTQLTFQAGIEQYPSLSPDGKWIVYVRATAPGNADIYLQSVGGQNAINLTQDFAGNDTQPAFSPEGDRIAFRSDRQGGGIFVMGRTGEFARKVTEAGFNAAWSPDGKAFVVSSVGPGPNPYARGGVGELSVVNADTGDRRVIYKGDAVQPHWSPKGQRIAFWGLQQVGSQRDLWTIAVNGGEPVAVTNDAPLDWNPVWSADGRHLYFSSDRGGSLNLWRVAIDEQSGAVRGAPQAVTTPASYVAHLSVSAQGGHLAYMAVANTSNIQRFELGPSRGTLSGNGSWVTSGSVFRQDVDVSWDGQWLAFRAGVAQEDLFVCRVDGTGLQQLTNDRARDRFPRWSPDGHRIVFYSDRSGEYELWTINPDGSGAAQLSKQDRSFSPGFAAWAPDGTRMAVTDARNLSSTVIWDPRKPWKDQRPDSLPPSGQPSRFRVYSWSPDGSRIVGARADAPEEGPIVIYELATRRYEELPGDPGNEPHWINNGRGIVYRTVDKLQLFDTVTRQTRQLLSVAPDVLRGLAVARDDKQVFILRGSNEADLWLATLKNTEK